MTISSIMWRRFDITDLSFIHAMTSLFLSLYIVLREAPHLEFWRWPQDWFLTPASDLQCVQFALSIFYFVFDSVIILRKVMRRPKFTLDIEEFAYLFHHVVCVMGLVPPIVTRKDGPIILIGFIAGELSNPPRFFAEHLGYELRDIRILKEAGLLPTKIATPAKVMRAYLNVFEVQYITGFMHFSSFIVFRAVLVYYTYVIMFPLCQLATSNIAAVAMLVFSIGSVIFLVMQRSKNPVTFIDLFKEDKKN